jgi:diacylglycerol kinase (ATP)
VSTNSKNQPFPARLRFALAGLAHAFRRERSLRIQGLALFAVAAALLILRPAPIWWALMILTCSGVIAAELINTAIETLADHLHPELHPQIRIVKDCAAAAVLILSLGAVLVAAALVVNVLR